jgi:hypothetical protein
MPVTAQGHPVQSAFDQGRVPAAEQKILRAVRLAWHQDQHKMLGNSSTTKTLEVPAEEPFLKQFKSRRLDFRLTQIAQMGDWRQDLNFSPCSCW